MFLRIQYVERSKKPGTMLAQLARSLSLIKSIERNVLISPTSTKTKQTSFGIKLSSLTSPNTTFWLGWTSFGMEKKFRRI